MAAPVLIAVDDDSETLRDLDRELRERYERHYRVLPALGRRGVRLLRGTGGRRRRGRAGSRWADARRALPYTVHIVGESWSGRAYELRRVLGRCALPHSFCLADSDEGRALLAATGGAGALPIVIFPNGAVLTDPSWPGPPAPQ